MAAGTLKKKIAVTHVDLLQGSDDGSSLYAQASCTHTNRTCLSMLHSYKKDVMTVTAAMTQV
jgi:hypothetical protein